MESNAAKHPSTDNHQPETLHEISTVQLKPIALFAVILAVTALATFATIKVLLDYMNFNFARVDVPLSPLATPEQKPPAPNLQVSSGQDLLELRAKEQTALSSYHWINKEQGIVSIPIERAIELQAQRGLPARETK